MSDQIERVPESTSDVAKMMRDSLARAKELIEQAKQSLEEARDQVSSAASSGK